MNKFVSAINTTTGRLITCVLITILWALFAYRHFNAFRQTGEWIYLLFCFSEVVTILMLAIRRAPETVSTDPLDWIFAVGGTLMPLVFSPAASGILPVAKYLVSVGSCMQILGLFSLNRSLAFVAAKRELKVGGMYRFMRHPLYASYLIMFSGYVLANTTLTNVAVYFLTLGLLFVRMLREEKHLAQDPAYCAYMQAVPYRLVPFVL